MKGLVEYYDPSNPILLTDSYKASHWNQLPPNTTKVFSYFESRGGVYDSVAFFGLQYLLKYLSGPVITNKRIRFAKELFRAHFGTDKVFNEAGWRLLKKKYNGRLPLEIRAVPEGTIVPTKNVLMTVVNTSDDKRLSFITNYVETILSQVWYPSTVATQSREMKKTILSYLIETGTPGLIEFMLQDFGFRGSTSPESAAIGGSGHLVNFKGTDNLAAILLLRAFYDEPMAGFSIPASEHFTITTWTKKGECRAYENMLKKYPTGPVAVVSDSYDIYHACEKLWGEKLHDKVMSRKGTLVVRPDSGNPPTVVLKVLEILGEKFGYTTNSLGYKVLDSHIRVIQGDGIDHAMIKEVLEAMKLNHWSADNIVFGSGGGLLQKVNRDTLKFAFKCCCARVNGKWRNVMKSPVTDPGKKSKSGLLKLVKINGEFKTQRYEDSDLPNELQVVFRDGEIIQRQTLAEIRERAKI